MGWDQVTARHVASFWDADLSLRNRMGLYYIFVLRWFSQFCGVIVALVNTKASIIHWLGGEDVGFDAPGYVLIAQHISFCLYGLIVLSAILRAMAHDFTLLPGLAMYFTALPLIICFTSVVLMVSLSRVVTGNTGEWVVTARTGPSTKVPLLEPQAEPGPEISGMARTLLAVGFLAQGAAAGTYIGYVVGQQPRQVEHPMWGWVPFGLGSTITTTYVTDGTAVIEGLAIGSGISTLVILFLAFSSGRLRSS